MQKKHDVSIFLGTLGRQEEFIITFFIVMTSFVYDTFTFGYKRQFFHLKLIVLNIASMSKSTTKHVCGRQGGGFMGWVIRIIF